MELYSYASDKQAKRSRFSETLSSCTQRTYSVHSLKKYCFCSDHRQKNGTFKRSGLQKRLTWTSYKKSWGRPAWLTPKFLQGAKPVWINLSALQLLRGKNGTLQRLIVNTNVFQILNSTETSTVLLKIGQIFWGECMPKSCLASNFSKLHSRF